LFAEKRNGLNDLKTYQRLIVSVCFLKKVGIAEIENCALMFEELERRVRPGNLFDLETDLEFDPTPTFDGLRHKPLDERMILMK